MVCLEVIGNLCQDNLYAQACVKDLVSEMKRVVCNASWMFGKATVDEKMKCVLLEFIIIM